MMRGVFAGLRSVWRRLPMSVRRVVGQALLRAAEPVLAAQLPSKATLTGGVNHQPPTVLGVFQAALGHTGRLPGCLRWN